MFTKTHMNVHEYRNAGFGDFKYIITECVNIRSESDDYNKETETCLFRPRRILGERRDCQVFYWTVSLCGRVSNFHFYVFIHEFEEYLFGMSARSFCLYSAWAERRCSES